MLKITTIDEANEALSVYIPLSREITGKNITLDRMTPLMKAVGNPESRLKIIHIAGTSGKTSTTYFITALLVATGKSVGTTVSPHVDSITERVQINGQPVGDAEFCLALTEFIDIVNSSGLNPTYFELLIAFAYWYFDRAHVDYAVIETGLGGLHDGTNVATKVDKICVITDIGFDHMHVLGKTIESIALQKAGIIHTGNHALMYSQSPAVNQVVTDWSTKRKATLTLLNQMELAEGLQITSAIKKLPAFQQRNWLLAYAAFRYVSARYSMPMLETEMVERTMHTLVPARMEVRITSGKTIVMDGAHNGQKMSAFITSFKKLYPNRKATVILSLKKGKEYTEILPLLLPVTDTLIVCGFESVQDMYVTSISPRELAGAAQEQGFQDVNIANSIDEAYNALISSTNNICIITGSFYLVSELRKRHTELKYA